MGKVQSNTTQKMTFCLAGGINTAREGNPQSKSINQII